MMKKKPSILRIVLFVVTWLLFPVFFITTFYQDKKEIQRVSYVALNDAITKDYQERYDKELKYSGGLLGRKIKGAHITCITS